MRNTIFGVLIPSLYKCLLKKGGLYGYPKYLWRYLQLYPFSLLALLGIICALWTGRNVLLSHTMPYAEKSYNLILAYILFKTSVAMSKIGGEKDKL